MRKRIVVIAAVAAVNNLMGSTKDDKQIIPWYCSEDFKHFKETTMGSAMIMGRKTLESLPGLLPGRPHIYLSRDTSPRDDDKYRKASRVTSLPEAIELAYQLSDANTIYIIGGAEIITLALQEDMIDEIIVTKIYTSVEEGVNPVYFPTLSTDWKVLRESEIKSSQRSEPDILKYQIIHYVKPQK